MSKSTTDRILHALADDGEAEQTDDGWVSHVPRPLREMGHGTDQLELGDDDPEGGTA